jgi:hypothetical protein
MTGVRYTTREAVKTALDVMETARANTLVDDAIESSSRSVESQLNRRFYPWTGTRYFDWPPQPPSWPWRLWLYQHEVISVSLLVAGGVTIPAANYNLEPVNDGPPYDRIEIKLSTSSAFSAGSTYQRAVAATGVFGYTADVDPAGTLAAAITTTSATTCDVTDSGIIGIGDTILVDSERMLVTNKAQLTTGQTITGDLAATAAGVTVGIQSGTAVAVGETILVDSERMLVVDQAGNNLTVRRAFDGSVLATHTTGATVYAPRRLTIVRGALGTTAATHLIAAPVSKGSVPGPVHELATAETLTALLQKQAGYARTVSAGDMVREVTGRGLADIRAQAFAAYGRKVRGRAV